MDKVKLWWAKIKRKKDQSIFRARKFINFVKMDRTVHLTALFVLLLIIPQINTPVVDLPFFNTASNAKDILLVVIQSLAQILGIIGALILITFQIHKRAFNALAMKQLFNRGVIRDTFLFYIYSIVYALVSLFLLNRIPSYSSIKYTQVSGALFVVALFLLIPLINKVFSFSRAVEQVKNQLNRLKYYGLRIFQYYDRMRLNSDYWKALEQHPIVVITDGAISALDEGDNIAVCQTIVEVNNYFFDYLDKASDKRETINSFLYFYKHLSLSAIKNKNQRILSLILDSVEQLHFLAAEKKYIWHEMVELNRFLEEFLRSCLTNSLDSVVNEAGYALQFINETHLEKNCPSPNELLDYDGGTLKIKDLPKDRGHDQDLQWDHISGEYMRLMAAIAEEAVNLSKPEIASHYARAFISLSDKTIEMNHLSDGMKGRIVRWAYYYSYSLTERILKFKLWELTKLPFPFSEFSIDRALATKSDYAKELLLKYSEAIIMLAKHKVLTSFYLNEYGAFGRGLTRNLEDDVIYRQSFKLVIQTLGKIRIIVAKQKDVPGDENIYSEVYKQTLSLKNWLKNSKSKKKYFPWVEKELKKFNKTLIERRQPKKYSNEWPSKIK